MLARSIRDRGQAAVMVVIVAAVLFVTLSVALVAFGGRLLDRARAQTAADAAALAATDGGRPAAELLARRHGATLVIFTQAPWSSHVTVVVRVGQASATAAATNAP